MQSVYVWGGVAGGGAYREAQGSVRRQRKIWAGAFTVDSMGKNKHVRISRARTD